ncbi:MAG TPA: glycosyltransferase family 39 protein, partial [Patescibacteria group bacterium]|nr:glycosyltransferase family 39 protein [Patescibacteria group bacterium]
MTQIVTLRLINVAMFVLGLVLFRMVLAKTKASPAVANAAVLFFTLTPVVGQLAAHINYDNMLMPCIAGSVLLTLHFRERLLDKKQFSSRSLAGIIILCSLASLVKYPFLPIFAGIVVYLTYLLWSVSHSTKQRLHLLKSFLKDWASVAKWQKTAIIIGLVVGVGLFSYTYGTNLIVYQNPVPQCGQVLGVARCQAYGPWARNFRAAQHIVNGPNIFYFIPNWIGGMFERLFFVVNGSTGPAFYQNFIAPVLAATAALGGAIGLFLFARHGRRNLSRDRALAVILFIMLAYVVALWARNYHDYVQLGQMVAINGRYLVLVVLPFYLAAAIGWQQWLAGRSTNLRLGLLTAAFLLCLQGGGIISYIVYSNQYWYWPDSKWVQTTNKNIQKVVKPFVWAPKIR